MNSDGTMDHLLDAGAHWRLLANTIEPSVCGVDKAFLSNCFDHLFMIALWNRETIYIFKLWFVLSSFFFFSSPILSGRRLDVYHTLAHGVALVRI